MYKTVIFDLDGTLLDTLDDLAAATNWALRQHGFAEHSTDEVRMMVGNGVGKLIERAIPNGAVNPEYSQTLADFKGYYVQHCRDNTRPYKGIIELLQTLKAAGVKTGIVSNKLQPGVSELQREFFDGLIDVAVGEREGVRRKPAPDMVLTAMKELGADKDSTIYVGDSDVDITTARNCGLPCIAVTWGFRDRNFLLVHGASTMADTPQDIASFLLSCQGDNL
ncbi:MAG: HAD family hydrolase [Bacteroidaceae bacterium]|nr:HAD family hydrolase [Bacteroidaceae bacterium]